jgi:hypothetical protein
VATELLLKEPLWEPLARLAALTAIEVSISLSIQTNRHVLRHKNQLDLRYFASLLISGSEIWIRVGGGDVADGILACIAGMLCFNFEMSWLVVKI